MQDVAIKQLIKPGNLHLRMFEKVRYRLHLSICSFNCFHASLTLMLCVCCCRKLHCSGI